MEDDITEEQVKEFCSLIEQLYWDEKAELILFEVIMLTRRSKALLFLAVLVMALAIGWGLFRDLPLTLIMVLVGMLLMGLILGGSRSK